MGENSMGGDSTSAGLGDPMRARSGSISLRGTVKGMFTRLLDAEADAMFYVQRYECRQNV